MEEEENYSRQTEPTWEHKALSGTDSTLCARCKSILWEAPEKGAYHQRRDSSNRIEPGKVRLYRRAFIISLYKEFENSV